MIRKISASLAIAALAAALSGCADKVDPLCPGAAALVETSVLTAFPDGAQPDPSHPLYRLAISSVSTDCSVDARARQADSSVEIHFVATRAQAGEAAQYRVPYYVAVRTGPEIVAKKVFWAMVKFDAGETSTNFDESIDSTTIKIANDKQPYEYQILVGLQLTKEQLEYNRKSGHYGL